MAQTTIKRPDQIESQGCGSVRVSAKCMWMCLALLTVLVLNAFPVAEGRYLPTRSQDDRLDKLRELLRDLLESEIQRANTVECAPQAIQLLPTDSRNERSNQIFRDLGFVERKRYFKRDTTSDSQETEQK